jgi:hypothetical protein
MSKRAITSSPKRKPNDEAIIAPHALALPKRGRGRPTPEATAKYEAVLDRWCASLIVMSDERAAQPDSFDVSSRGWCYLLEPYGLLKGDFDTAQKLINTCRKHGRLPLDFCCEDSRRVADNLEDLDDPDPKARAAAIVRYVNKAEEYYHPFSFWEAQDTYVEIMVEKVDLKNLFSSVCAGFRIAIFNGAGWSDLHSRAAMMKRFAYWERRGKRCVLLYCGDLDPGGLHIADFIRSNLADMSRAVGWSPDNLIIDRFGIDEAFINRHRVTWIENLHTSKKGGLALDDINHNDHDKAYVQDYIVRYGARKVEATAMVEPRLVPHARALCRKAILKYLPANAPEQYESSLELPRRKLRAEIKRLLKVVS